MTINRDECPRALSLAVHEFRSPVTVVAGYIRMLLKMQPDPSVAMQRKLLEEAEKSCGRLSALIAEMGDLAKMEAGQVAFQKSEFDLFDLVAEVAKSVHEGADRDVRLEMIPITERAPVEGDAPRLSEALTTLMHATLRERAEPGVIRARGGVHRGDRPPLAYMVLAAPDGTEAPPPFDASLWAPFDQFRGGVGFRLMLAQAVVAAHGGTLFSGQGAHARAACALTLPLKESSC